MQAKVADFLRDDYLQETLPPESWLDLDFFGLLGLRINRSVFTFFAVFACGLSEFGFVGCKDRVILHPQRAIS
ncbi:MAG: hypothetical protein ABJB86_05800 [Bacteroidota bacterium]